MPALEQRRFTVDEFHQMADAGIFAEDDRVELLRGAVVPMTPIGVGHAACVNRLNRLLQHPRVTIAVQNPVVLATHDEPQPDLSVLRFRPDGYAAAHPGPADILLLIEVADTSVAKDREKMTLYAEADIAEAWLVNLPEDCVEVYRNPRDGRYQDVRTAHHSDSLAPVPFPDLALGVADILGAEHPR